MPLDIPSLADHAPTGVINKAVALTACYQSAEDKIAALFSNVSDDIKFQFQSKRITFPPQESLNTAMIKATIQRFCSWPCAGHRY